MSAIFWDILSTTADDDLTRNTSFGKIMSLWAGSSGMPPERYWSARRPDNLPTVEMWMANGRFPEAMMTQDLQTDDYPDSPCEFRFGNARLSKYLDVKQGRKECERRKGLLIRAVGFSPPSSRPIVVQAGSSMVIWMICFRGTEWYGDIG